MTRRLVTRHRAIGFANHPIHGCGIGVCAFLRKGSNRLTLKSVAYDLYLRGKLKNNDHNRESNDAAIKLLEQAVATDPNFAPAYAELARAYGTKGIDFFAADPERKKLSEDAK